MQNTPSPIKNFMFSFFSIASSHYSLAVIYKNSPPWRGDLL
jgi:hypothetical protein